MWENKHLRVSPSQGITITITITITIIIITTITITIKLKAKKYDSIKLYCSEILSILLQADALICNKLCNMNDTNGVESLLEAISYYRKRDPNGMEEQECIENIFLSLSSVLMEPGHYS